MRKLLKHLYVKRVLIAACLLFFFVAAYAQQISADGRLRVSANGDAFVVRSTDRSNHPNRRI
jgi:hypothetical protein